MSPYGGPVPGEIESVRLDTAALAFQRAEELIGQHERYYRAVGTEARSGRLHVVEPVIPMDILGLYIFLSAEI
jgi:hypothetical protein